MCPMGSAIDGVPDDCGCAFCAAARRGGIEIPRVECVRALSVFTKYVTRGGCDARSDATTPTESSLDGCRDWRRRSSSGAAARGLGKRTAFRLSRRLFADAENRRSLSTWAPAIERLLTTIGWPGAQVPTSQEFQLLNRWRELLNQLTSLDVVSRPVSLKTAVHS